MNPENKKFWDKSTKLLVISNIVTIIFVIVEGWDFHTVLWIYWFQSIIIGYFNYKRILKLKNFKTENFYINDQPVTPNEKSKKQVASFFLMHYGFFHLAYFMVLNGFGIFTKIIDSKYLVFSFAIGVLSFIASIYTFYFNHKTSFELNYQEDLKGNVNIGTLMFMPYVRIVQMHLIIIFANSSIISSDTGSNSMYSISIMLFFLLMKTAADVSMHKIEHKYLRKNAITTNPELIIKN